MSRITTLVLLACAASGCAHHAPRAVESEAAEKATADVQDPTHDGAFGEEVLVDSAD